MKNLPVFPLTPRRKKAFNEFERSKFRAAKYSMNLDLKKRLQDARRKKYEANQNHTADDIKNASNDNAVELLVEPVGMERARPPTPDQIMTSIFIEK